MASIPHPLGPCRHTRKGSLGRKKNDSILVSTCGSAAACRSLLRATTQTACVRYASHHPVYHPLPSRARNGGYNGPVWLFRKTTTTTSNNNFNVGSLVVEIQIKSPNDSYRAERAARLYLQGCVRSREQALKLECRGQKFTVSMRTRRVRHRIPISRLLKDSKK